MRAMVMTVFLGFCLAQCFGCASTYEGNISDHFDGKRFYNPTLAEQFSPGFLGVLRMLMEGRAEWPEYVENEGIPRLHEKLGPDDIALTFVNHVTFLIQFPQLNILTDPVWSKRVSPFPWIGPARVREPGIRFEDLPGIDLIIISHNHYDHLDTETLKKLNERFSPEFIVPVGDKALLESIGIRNVRELDWWDSIQIDPETRITFTPAQHGSGRGLFDRNLSLWGGYFIRHRGFRIHFDGDSGYSTHYAEIKRRLGPPDIALLGIGAYLPRWFMKTIHMSPAEAVIAHKDLGAALSIGMHFGTFQLSAEAFDQPRKDLEAALDAEMLSRESFIILHEGETTFHTAGKQE